MKKQITREETICDFCHDATCFRQCRSCGKDVCYECEEKCGKRFQYEVFAGGSYDGFYCYDCLTNKNLIDNKIYCTYARIEDLRQDYKRWYETWNKQVKIAEAHLMMLLKQEREQKKKRGDDHA